MRQCTTLSQCSCRHLQHCEGSPVAVGMRSPTQPVFQPVWRWRGSAPWLLVHLQLPLQYKDAMNKTCQSTIVVLINQTYAWNNMHSIFFIYQFKTFSLMQILSSRFKSSVLVDIWCLYSQTYMTCTCALHFRFPCLKHVKSLFKTHAGFQPQLRHYTV